jgi:hypothetical protein
MLEVTTHQFLRMQLAMDGVLCLLILVLLWQIRRFMGRKTSAPGEKEMQALRQLVEDSRGATDHFLTAVQESRTALKDLVHALDEREKRIRELLASCPESREPEADLPSPGDARASQVLALAARGFPEREIARQTGIPDGEVHLILNLTGQR